MKINIVILFVGIIFLSCNSSEKTISENENKEVSRILSKELKEFLPELIKLYYFTNEIDDQLCARFLISKEFVYLNIMPTSFGCAPNFIETIDNNSINFLIDPRSFEPQRYFNIKEEDNVITNFDSNDLACILHPPNLSAKFKRIDESLELVLISTYLDNNYIDTFYDKSDSLFLRRNKIFIEEPEPILPSQPTE